jgi:hypothetical protein
MTTTLVAPLYFSDLRYKLNNHGNSNMAPTRLLVLSVAKMLFLCLANIPFVHASPILRPIGILGDAPDGKSPEDPGMWVYLGTAVALVLLGGAFAGLTIAYVSMQT